MKKVLIISYYWPPSGGSGVQRWLKFVKYLQEFNCEPIVYTPENGEFPEIDNSLLKDIPDNITILKQPIWEPYSFYKKFTGKKKKQKIGAGFVSDKKGPSFLEKVSVWIRGNFFIPDARCFWIKPSIKYLTNYLKENKIDAIISTGPPHSMHLIALGVKKNIEIPWIADFRDLWTEIDFYDDLLLTRRSDKKHKRLENNVITRADKIITISNSCADDLRKIGAKNVDVITNGFDSDDVPKSKTYESDKFLFLHIGTLNKDRNDNAFLEVVGNLCKEDEQFKNDFRIKYIGKTDYTVKESIKDNNLEDNIEIVDYLPHNEVFENLLSAKVLYLPINNTPNVKGILPGKLFEYLSVNKPIFVVGSEDGDTSKVIEETNSGLHADFFDREKLKENLLFYYKLFKEDKLYNNSSNIEKFSRKSLTKRLVEVIEETII